MGVVENLKDIGELAQKVGQIELYKKILQAEDEVRDLTRTKRSLEDKVEELEQTLKIRKSMTFKPPFYYLDGDEIPFCPTCHEKDQRTLHLLKQDETDWFCNVCKNFYETGPQRSSAVFMQRLQRG